ncbi:malic enzyme [Gluconobacter frateurii NBRC 103465]|nr:malic enzyme [Gluconobacter frateurii NBRC 103465]
MAKRSPPGRPIIFYIFPAVALAVWATQARRITDEVFLEAARATAEQVTPEQRAHGLLFPPQKDVLRVEINTAIKVARQIFKSGLAQVPEPEDIVDWIEAKLYRPGY